MQVLVNRKHLDLFRDCYTNLGNKFSNKRNLVILGHSQKSNWFSPDGAVRQNWCILRRNDKYKKFRVFPEVFDSGIFETSEPKTEPPELPKHW